MYLHEECRIIHTDIKPENILICVKENHAARMSDTVNRFKEFNVPMPASYCKYFNRILWMVDNLIFSKFESL